MTPDQATVVLAPPPTPEGTRPQIRFRTAHTPAGVEQLLCQECRSTLMQLSPSTCSRADIDVRTLEIDAVPPLPELFRGLAQHPQLLADLYGGTARVADTSTERISFVRVPDDESEPTTTDTTQ